MATRAGLVDFDTPAETVPPRSGHGAAHLVEPGPGCPVAARAEEALEAQGPPTELLIRHEPHGPKPQSQRLARAFEDCSRNRRRLPLACRAPKSTSGRCPGRVPVAGRAQKAIRPSQALQQVGAGRLGREELVELLPCPRVVSPADWMVIGGHLSIACRREGSGYPFAEQRRDNIHVVASCRGLESVLHWILRTRHRSRFEFSGNLLSLSFVVLRPCLSPLERFHRSRSALDACSGCAFACGVVCSVNANGWLEGSRIITPYYQDLRDRVLAAYDRGMRTKDVATVFNISPPGHVASSSGDERQVKRHTVRWDRRW